MFANLSKKIWFFLFILPLTSSTFFTKPSKSAQKASPTAAKSTKHARTKKRTPKRPHADVLWKNMTEQQHIDLLDYARIIKDSELEFKILLHLSKTAKQQSNLKKYLLELADLYFEKKNLPKALEYYEAYCTLFPGSLHAEYAGYKAVISSFYTTLEPNRDSTPTEESITRATQFLKTAIRDDYRDEAKSIIQQCTVKLFTHEVYVFDHYIKQQRYSSAEKRLEYIKKQFKNLKDAERLLPHLEEVLQAAKDPSTRSFFVGVDFNYGKEQKLTKTSTRTKASDRKRHVDRIRI